MIKIVPDVALKAPNQTESPTLIVWFRTIEWTKLPSEHINDFAQEFDFMNEIIAHIALKAAE